MPPPLFPVDAARINTNVSTASDPWTVTLPASNAEELLVMWIRLALAATTVAGSPTGWTYLIDDNSADASDDATGVLYKWTDGTEGTSVSVDMSSSTKGAAIVWRITGAVHPSTQAPEVGTVGTGTGANPDPGAVTPTGGSKDYLFLAMAGLDGETQTYTAPGGGYGNLIEANSGTAGVASTNVRLGGASLQKTASSEDPGAFTAAAPSSGWTAVTVAIHPNSYPEVIVPVMQPPRRARR